MTSVKLESKSPATKTEAYWENLVKRSLCWLLRTHWGHGLFDYERASGRRLRWLLNWRTLGAPTPRLLADWFWPEGFEDSLPSLEADDSHHPRLRGSCIGRRHHKI